MTPHEIRTRYLEYFKARGHEIVPSAPLLPENDPTLLFTTAGMVQFKNLWAGAPLPYPRAASVQKCLRAGGKGSDLDNVGRTLRHHTFFEMLGNFSFGDYFKAEAIDFALEFLLEVLRMDRDRLWVSVFEQDDEARDLWIERGFPRERIVKLGAADNFWGPAGREGACGPCSEIYYDLGPEYSCGGPACAVGCDCERYLEFWNLVFPQFYQQPDGARTPLERRGVDTGMGLERIAFLLDPHAANNYQTRVFRPLIEALSSLSSQPYQDEWIASYHVIADHLRALTFALGDGILPANEGRGYVLRRILRRAVRFGKKMGVDKPFLSELVPEVVEQMRCQYPDLEKNRALIVKMVRAEEEKFLRTLSRGSAQLEEAIRLECERGNKSLQGETVFRLYDTYGLPLELIEEVAGENRLSIDRDGFRRFMQSQKAKGKQSWKGTNFSLDEALKQLPADLPPTRFTGYEHPECPARVLCLLSGEESVPELPEGAEALAVFDVSPFYAESGGQVADTGLITWNDGKARVSDVQSSAPGWFLHSIKGIRGTLTAGSTVRLSVDAARRLEIQKHHTATHILQSVLRKHLGDHVKQAGSFVGPDRLRFDFSHTHKLSADTLKTVEDEVNDAILENRPVLAAHMTLEEARKRPDILANFGDKYGEKVRMISVQGLSHELCGGIHIPHTGLIGGFRVLSETSVSAGVRRIEAVTGRAFVRRMRDQSERLSSLQAALKVPEDKILEKFDQMAKKIKDLEKQSVERLAARDAAPQSVLDRSFREGDIDVIVRGYESLSDRQLLALLDGIKSRRSRAAIFLASRTPDRILFLAARRGTKSPDCSAWIREITALAEGKGGGRPDMARGAGRDPERFNESIHAAEEWIRGRLGESFGDST